MGLGNDPVKGKSFGVLLLTRNNMINQLHLISQPLFLQCKVKKRK